MIISYAQNLEDVVLDRALSNLKIGFYIDVGANDPIVDSVTKHFYESGWKGVNIEPAKKWFEKLKSDRPRDICLNVAVSDEVGVSQFHDIDSSGLSTLFKDVAEQHGSLGFGQTTYEVQTLTLARVCELYAGDTIHFLKIDVEGAEEKVLRGADFVRFRPWVVLVEATEPMSSTPSHFAWDQILKEADYDFVLFDGLNRFYVAREKSELSPFFSFPGDRYKTSETVWTIGHWQRIAAEREAELAVLKSSRWWRSGEKLKSILGKTRA
jgi:FkbM family methyltransferase